MLLAVDVGNTNTVLGLFNGDELVRSWRITTHARATGDEMALTFRGLLDEQSEITGLALCSTVPSVLHELRPMLSSFFHAIPVVIVEPGTKTGVPILTDNPKEVGADRIVNTLAAHQQFGGPCIVVDFGTSTNLDVVSAQGEFLGGALAPGIDISLEALSSKAANSGRSKSCARGHLLARTQLRLCNQVPSSDLRDRSMASLIGLSRRSDR